MSRKPKDLTIYHGHRVVDGEHLRSQFEEEPDPRAQRSHLFRTIRHAFMLGLLIAIVLGGVGGAVAVLNGYLVIPQPGSSPKPSLGCPAGPFDYTGPETVRVNVLNAAGREGLAKSVADQLTERKFGIGRVDNAKATGSTPALIVGGSAGASAAFTLQRSVPGSVFVPDGRGDATVDLVLLPGFRKLQDPGLVDQTPGSLVCAGPTASALPSAEVPGPGVPTAP